MNMTTQHSPPPVSMLHELFWYDANSGVLTRRVDAGRFGKFKAESIVGTPHNGGYLMVGIDGARYLVHRVAFAISNGQWPECQIDHIDGNRANNRLLNLRDVSPCINSQNQRHARGVTESGLLGVSRQRNRWKAEIRTNGKRRFLGVFDTPEDAHACYLNAKRYLHEGCSI